MTERLSVTITREYDAPIELVYQAWADSQKATQWMKCHPGVKLSYEGWKPAVGARYTSVMEKPDEWKVEGSGRFTEVSPPHVLEYASDANQAMQMPEMTIRVELEDLGGDRTRLTLTHSGIPNDDMCGIIHGGWSQGLTLLSDVVATMA